MPTPIIAIPRLARTPELETQLAPGPARPAVLFPVRLETRFAQLPNGAAELRVRVYPDTLHIDTHEPELTDEEAGWGRHFWEQTWRAGGEREHAIAAWRQLADRFDAPRAAWIARALQPLNPDDRPAAPVAAGSALPTAPRFASPPARADVWTRAPLARMLPSRWIVLGYQAGRLVVNATGNPIPEQLPAGPDPGGSVPDGDDRPPLDDGMRWMFDFDAAEQVGMAVRAGLSAQDAAAGLDFVLVMGVRDTPGGAAGQAPLAGLLEAHHYTGGLSIVPSGTPSNNTQDAPSGWSSADPGHAASYAAEREAATPVPGDGSNAELLAGALGLETRLFAGLAHAADTEQLDARAINTVLWPATWGYFLEQMLGAGRLGENPLSEDDIAWTRAHFVESVRPLGPLPALRIGKQPYGVLPVSSLDAWQPRAGRETALRDFLLKLRDVWRRSAAEAPRLGRSADTTSESGMDRDLADVLGMDGLSSGYAIRGLLGRHYMEHLGVSLSAGFFVDAWQAPEPEPFEEQPFEEEEPPEDLTPQQRAAWIRAQRARRLAWIREQEALRRAHARAQEARQALIDGKLRALDEWWTTQHRLAGTLLRTLGLSWQPRLANALFLPPVAELRGALVQEPGVETQPASYIAALLAARSVNDVRHQTALQPPPRTLLYLLLRHGMLLEYTRAATRMLLARGLLQPEQRREPELVDLVDAQLTHTVWRQLTRKIDVGGEAEPIEIGKYLLGFLPSGEPDLAREPSLQPLGDFRAGLARLQSLAVPRLEQLLSATLDACSHRLDAWITSLATGRLAELRRERPGEVLYGGYGWVTNLRPATARPIEPPPGERAPLLGAPDNPGFVHAPSLAQATTAAILRSGHLAHIYEGASGDVLAIDLSSERVRLASWLLDGVRQGQPLGALLGYRFERHLNEQGVAQFIAHFRELAPLVARKRDPLEQPAGALETIAANNVVDGLALQGRWLRAKRLANPPSAALGVLFSTLANGPSPAEIGAAQAKLEAELDVLDGAVDAVGDALMAESVYQVVRGNPLRAAATVESIAGGETPPPELEVVRTPRSGIALTHRLVALWSGEPVLPGSWPAHSARAAAEPWLNAWAARLLGDPARARCIVERLDQVGSQVVESRELSLDRLQLAPLDLIYAVEGGANGQQAELEQRILYTITRAPDGFAPGSNLRVNYGRRAEWTAAELGYGEFDELLRAARRMLTAGRALDAGDLQPPERGTDAGVDVRELEQRAAAAEQALRLRAQELATLLDAPDTAGLEPLRLAMLQAAGFGVAGAVPLSAQGDRPSDRQILLAQAGSINGELARRGRQLDALADGDTTTAEQQRDRAVARLRIVFGNAFVVLPRFAAANAAELAQALAGSAALMDGDPIAASTWFGRTARVRDGVARLQAALSYAEALDSGERLALNIAQLPHVDGQRWAALPFEDGQGIAGGKLSLAVQASAPLDVQQPLAGLLIDEWVEVVPGASETTAIAFQYDAPNAAPPQAILVAVPPEPEAPWTVWSLQQVLLETLDLARIRAVDPDTLDEVGQYLPALYFAANSNGDTVATDWTTIKAAPN